MGVFYQPPPRIQIDFTTQLPSVGGSSGRAPKGRDLAVEKRNAEAEASVVSKGDPELYAAHLTKLGYAEDAVKYKDTYAKTKEQELKVRELEVDQTVDQLRVAADLAKGGNEQLAIRVANKMVENPEEKYVSLKYSPKNNKVESITASGQKQSLDIDNLIKSATDSKTQFQEQAATYRTKLQTMKDPRTLSPTDLLGISMVKRLEIEKDLGTGAKYDDIIKRKPYLELAPLEKEMILKWQQGDLGSVVAAATQANPGMFDTYGAKTPEAAAGIIARIFKSTQDQLRKETSPSADPKSGGAGAPNISKGGESTSINTSERSHPSFKENKDGTLLFKDKDGNKITVHPSRKDEAIKDGLTPVTE